MLQLRSHVSKTPLSSARNLCSEQRKVSESSIRGSYSMSSCRNNELRDTKSQTTRRAGHYVEETSVCLCLGSIIHNSPSCGMKHWGEGGIQ